MKKIKPYCFLILFLVAFISENYAQHNDAALRTSIALEKRVSPKLLAHFKEAVRIRQNITQLNYAYSDVGLTYKVHRNIFASLDYRFISKLQPAQYLSYRHRLYVTVLLKKKLKPFIINARFIFQTQMEDIYSSEMGKVPDYYERTKISLKYELNRFTPYVAAELYAHILRWEQVLPNRYRLFAGFDYELNKTNDLEFFYLFEKHFHEKNPLTNYVVGIGYTHRFY